MDIQQAFADACATFSKTDKVSHHGYHRFYPYFLDPLRSQFVRMIEIGVDRQGSLEFWHAYFSDLEYFGIDIKDIEIDADKFPTANIIKGDQSDPVFVAGIKEAITEKVHFIIDDGSHMPAHQAMTFNHLFSDVLVDGGVYIIEDVETSYWKRGVIYGYDCSYGVGHPQSIVEIFKRLLDGLNKEFCKGEIYSPSEPVPHDVSDKIEMISFVQNAIIIVKKSPAKFGKYYDRIYRWKDRI